MTRARLIEALVWLGLLAFGACCLRADGMPPQTLTLKHDEITRRLRTEIPSGSITYKDGRLVIRGSVRRFGLLWPFALKALFSRHAGRVRLSAEELSVNGKDRGDKLAEVDAKLAPLVDEESRASRVEIIRGGKAVFEQEMD